MPEQQIDMRQGRKMTCLLLDHYNHDYRTAYDINDMPYHVLDNLMSVIEDIFSIEREPCQQCLSERTVDVTIHPHKSALIVGCVFCEQSSVYGITL